MIELIRATFSHRRKSLPRSLELARPGSLKPARAALAELGLAADARAEALDAAQLASLAEKVEEAAP